MKTTLKSALVIFGLFSAFTAAAAPHAVVESVQAPAWVERGERRLPLTPGMQLDNRDRLITGPGSRAVLQLADGSAVRFGENASVGVSDLAAPRGGVFTAALDVAKGAFRLTTNIFRKLKSQREINVRTGTVTIGIRGTDVWGRANAEKDLVCLIEGRVSVSHPLAVGATELTEPLQFYVADNGKAPGPVGNVEPSQLAQWALETELQDGAPTQQAGGRWLLDFGLHPKPEALAIHDQLTNAGYASRLLPQRGSDGYRYRVRIGQLLSEQDARLLAVRLMQALSLETPPAVRR
jgi:hypothetical protein